MGTADIFFKLGDRVIVRLGSQKFHSVPATVLFIGETAFSPGVWIGVELTKPLGKHNGVVDGISYFSCEEPFGLFVRPSAVSPAPSTPRPSSRAKRRSFSSPPSPSSSSVRSRGSSPLRTGWNDSTKVDPLPKPAVHGTRPGMSPREWRENLRSWPEDGNEMRVPYPHQHHRMRSSRSSYGGSGAVRSEYSFASTASSPSRYSYPHQENYVRRNPRAHVQYQSEPYYRNRDSQKSWNPPPPSFEGDWQHPSRQSWPQNSFESRHSSPGCGGESNYTEEWPHPEGREYLGRGPPPPFQPHDRPETRFHPDQPSENHNYPSPRDGSGQPFQSERRGTVPKRTLSLRLRSPEPKQNQPSAVPQPQSSPSHSESKVRAYYVATRTTQEGGEAVTETMTQRYTFDKKEGDDQAQLNKAASSQLDEALGRLDNLFGETVSPKKHTKTHSRKEGRHNKSSSSKEPKKKRSSRSGQEHILSDSDHSTSASPSSSDDSERDRTLSLWQLRVRRRRKLLALWERWKAYGESGVDLVEGIRCSNFDSVRKCCIAFCPPQNPNKCNARESGMVYFTYPEVLRLSRPSSFTLETWVATRQATGDSALFSSSRPHGYVLGIENGSPVFECHLRGERSGSNDPGVVDNAAGVQPGPSPAQTCCELCSDNCIILRLAGANANVADGRWHHLCVTVSAPGEAAMFVDGALVLSTPLSHRTDFRFTGGVYSMQTYQGLSAYLGGTISSELGGFVGYLARTRLWSSVTETGNVGRLQYLDTTGAEPGLICSWPGYWRNDNTSGDVFLDEHSQNGCHALVRNGASIRFQLCFDPASSIVVASPQPVSPYDKMVPFEVSPEDEDDFDLSSSQPAGFNENLRNTQQQHHSRFDESRGGMDSSQKSPESMVRPLFQSPHSQSRTSDVAVDNGKNPAADADNSFASTEVTSGAGNLRDFSDSDSGFGVRFHLDNPAPDSPLLKQAAPPVPGQGPVGADSHSSFGQPRPGRSPSTAEKKRQISSTLDTLVQDLNASIESYKGEVAQVSMCDSSDNLSGASKRAGAKGESAVKADYVDPHPALFSPSTTHFHVPIDAPPSMLMRMFDESIGRANGHISSLDARLEALEFVISADTTRESGCFSSDGAEPTSTDSRDDRRHAHVRTSSHRGVSYDNVSSDPLSELGRTSPEYTHRPLCKSQRHHNTHGSRSQRRHRRHPSPVEESSSSDSECCRRCESHRNVRSRNSTRLVDNNNAHVCKTCSFDGDKHNGRPSSRLESSRPLQSTNIPRHVQNDYDTRSLASASYEGSSLGISFSTTHPGTLASQSWMGRCLLHDSRGGVSNTLHAYQRVECPSVDDFHMTLDQISSALYASKIRQEGIVRERELDDRRKQEAIQSKVARREHSRRTKSHKFVPRYSQDLSPENAPELGKGNDEIGSKSTFEDSERNSEDITDTKNDISAIMSRIASIMS
eukprot:Rmarinus@m.29186